MTATDPDAVDAAARNVFDKITAASPWRAVLFDGDDNQVPA